MHLLFSKHPAFWRAIAGLVIGTLFPAIGALAIALNIVEPLQPLVVVFLAPTLGISALLEIVDVRSDVIEMTVALFFFPVLGCVIGFFVGERQRPAIIIAEVIIAAVLIGVWMLGFVALNEVH